ncbi:hypothetical protein M3D44_011800 [Micrococcus luteus]|nr:hypothetical protein [Micrococcus luteus]
MTTQQTTTIPAGFAPVQIPLIEGESETFISYQGPASGHVSTYWNEGHGVTVALDGLGASGREGMDLSPTQAHILAQQLATVADALEDLQAPAIEAVARELAAMKRPTITDLGDAAHVLGVRPSVLMGAYEAATVR